MSKEAMKQALEALTFSQSDSIAVEELIDDAIIALEEALAKQEQGEPVWSLEDCVRTLKTLNYIEGIAVKGEGRQMREDESLEQFILGYVKRLEAAFAKQEQGEPAPVQKPVCQKCGGTGKVEEGGVYPSGDLAYLPCECATTSPAAQHKPLTDKTEGRSDLEIVIQTEDVAALLMLEIYQRELGGIANPFRDSENPRAKHCWRLACRLQEMLTNTDPMNAVAAVDDETAHGIKD
jgi:hypothetical protein